MATMRTMRFQATTQKRLNFLKKPALTRILITAVLAIAVFPSNAYAYLDAGTGSMIIQMLIGGVAATLVVSRTHWTRIKNFFGRDELEASGDDEDNDGH